MTRIVVSYVDNDDKVYQYNFYNIQATEYIHIGEAMKKAGIRYKRLTGMLSIACGDGYCEAINCKYNDNHIMKRYGYCQKDNERYESQRNGNNQVRKCSKYKE